MVLQKLLEMWYKPLFNLAEADLMIPRHQIPRQNLDPHIVHFTSYIGIDYVMPNRLNTIQIHWSHEGKAAAKTRPAI